MPYGNRRKYYRHEEHRLSSVKPRKVTKANSKESRKENKQVKFDMKRENGTFVMLFCEMRSDSHLNSVGEVTSSPEQQEISRNIKGNIERMKEVRYEDHRRSFGDSETVAKVTSSPE